eukprot:m.1638108 g.1638108  ORF g.1638108 m.1638108 type:complete len:437 (+) comp26846_c0_seq1:238-1548(+)
MSIQPPMKASAVGPSTLADLHAGFKETGDCGTSNTVPPDWYDEARFLRVNAFFQQHAATLVVVWYCSLAIGFSLPALLGALVFTGNSSTPSECIKRYVATFQHLMDWHLGNIFDPTSKAWKSVNAVRGMHEMVRTDINGTLPPGSCPGGGVWMSQYNMACVQAGFMGLMTTHSDKLGVNLTEQEEQDYIFFWRGVGYQLGIADKYNLCSLGKPYTDNIVEEISDQLVFPDIATPPEKYYVMANAFVDGLNDVLPLKMKLFSVPSALGIVFWLGDRPVPPMLVGDKIRYALLRFFFLLVQWAPWFEKLTSSLLIFIFRALPDPTGKTEIGTRQPEMNADHTAATETPTTKRQCPFSGVVIDMKKSNAGVGMTTPMDVDVFRTWSKRARNTRTWRFRVSVVVLLVYFCALSAAIAAFVYFGLIPFTHSVQRYMLTGRP